MDKYVAPEFLLFCFLAMAGLLAVYYVMRYNTKIILDENAQRLKSVEQQPVELEKTHNINGHIFTLHPSGYLKVSLARGYESHIVRIKYDSKTFEVENERAVLIPGFTKDDLNSLIVSIAKDFNLVHRLGQKPATPYLYFEVQSKISTF